MPDPASALQGKPGMLPRLLHRRTLNWLLPLILFLLLACASLLAARWQAGIQRESRELAATVEAASITAEIREQLQLHAQFLRSVQAFAMADTGINLARWRRFALAIDLDRGLSGLFAYAYAPAMRRPERTGLIAAVREQADRADFRVFPESTADLSTPIIFIAPDKPPLQSAVGFDLYSDAVRREAIETAIATRNISMSGPIFLVPDGEARRPSFLMLHALYHPGMPLNDVEERRQAFSGVVLTAYRTDDFLNALQVSLKSHLRIRIHDDGGSSGQATLIYDSAPELAVDDDTASHHHEIDFGGRNWVLRFFAPASGSSESLLDTPTLILAGGVLAAALLGLLFYHLATHRERAERYARHLTHELRDSEERLRLASRGTNDGIWDHDLRHDRSYISDRLLDIFGLTPDTAPNNLGDFAAYFPAEDEARRRTALRRHLRDGEPYDIELRLQRPDGGLRWVRLRGEAVRDASGRAQRIAGSVSDITDRKQAELELVRHRDHLEEMVDERTAKLVAAVEQARAANQAKSEFLANMSHELRTPMHAILSFSQLGLEKADACGQPKMSHYFGRVEQSATRLLGLINELLDLSKLESGHMELRLETISLTALAQEAISHLEPLLLQRRLQLDFDAATDLSPLTGDRERLLQVIHNLLSNAIKFSPDGGRVTVRIQTGDLPSGRRAGDTGRVAALELSIEDEGIGIPENELAIIFEKFIQSSATKSGAGGTGLGLAICRAIVSQHRGTIEAKNRASGGACFTVMLPLTDAKE
ncbi:MAG: PAS domain S-box protein [Dechloromonas sp.]|nr:MAG: PAS domain S-box protein [Dechloromonas sp.]